MPNYIPQGVFKKYYEVVDELLENSATSFSCRLYYTPIHSECTNCLFSYGNASNIYKPGGPIEFTHGLCPVCNGKGYLHVESTEDVRFRVHQYTSSKQNKKFKLLNKNIEDYSGVFEIRGNKNNIQKLLKTEKIFIDINNKSFGDYYYKLISEPEKHGFGFEYFFALIERI